MEITQRQKYEILQEEIQNGVGLDQIIKIGLEILMKSEREAHNLKTNDYSNGYRYRKMYGSGKLLEHFPKAEVQLCTVHLQREFAKYVRPKDKALFCAELRMVFQSEEGDTQEEGIGRWENFCDKWGRLYPVFKKKKSTERTHLYFTYLNYDFRIRSMIYSTNWIERLNRMYKKVVKMRGALPNTDAAMLLLCNVAMTVKAYDYPVTSFRFENQWFKWDVD